MALDVTNDTGGRIGELVRQRQADLSPAERKLARVLLASYPIAGLESVARFAERAGVSAPTVTRFITKLGFRSFARRCRLAFRRRWPATTRKSPGARALW